MYTELNGQENGSEFGSRKFGSEFKSITELAQNNSTILIVKKNAPLWVRAPLSWRFTCGNSMGKRSGLVFIGIYIYIYMWTITCYVYAAGIYSVHNVCVYYRIFTYDIYIYDIWYIYIYYDDICIYIICMYNVCIYIYICIVNSTIYIYIYIYMYIL